MASIHKRENKGRTTYQIKYRVNDKIRSKTVPTAKMAREFKSRIEHELREGIYIDTANILLSDFLDQWLIVHSQKVRAVTLESYKVIAKIVKGYIGDIRLQKLLSTDIEGMYTKHSKGRSARSVYYLHQVMSMAMKYAFKSQMVKNNVMSYVDPPRRGKANVATIKYSDIPKYLDCIKSSWIYPAVVMAMFMGMRRAEIFALDWDHVDFNTGEIHIEFVHKIIDGKLVITPPKNHEERFIPIPDNILTMLKEHRQEHRICRIQMGKMYQTKCRYTGKVINNVLLLENGQRPSPSSITQFFKRRQSIAELPVVSFHSLKHTAATLMDLAGINSKVISGILAHKSVKFTDDVYKYIFDEQMDAARKLMNENIMNKFEL